MKIFIPNLWNDGRVLANRNVTSVPFDSALCVVSIASPRPSIRNGFVIVAMFLCNLNLDELVDGA